MKRVGILTFHHVHNFGAVLQAWSLANAIANLGHSVEVVNYQPVIGHSHQRKGWRRFVPSLGKLQMQRFVSKHMPVDSRPLQDPEQVSAYIDAQRFDAIVCGSDQVWMIYDHQGVDKPYFLGVGSNPNLRRLSYAPSAGSRQSFGAFSPNVKELLAQFDAVSVRDSNTAMALAELDLPEPTRVLDPTLISDFSSLLKKNRATDGIVVVGKMDAAADRYIKFAADVLGCEVRAIGSRSSAATSQRPFASPIEWLNEIGSAKLVVTSLFHGAAVSMALRTPFVALDCGGRAFKLKDLFSYLDIPNRLLERTEGAADYVQAKELLSMDYAELDPRLRTEADKSRAFLDAAIRG